MRQNKVAVVTGGSGVLGSAFCQALAQHGYKVAILGRDLAKAEELAATINLAGGIALAVHADVTDRVSLETASEQIKQQLGSCDVLINGAGGNHPKGTSSAEYYTDDLRRQANATSFFDLELNGIDFVFKLNLLVTLLPS